MYDGDGGSKGELELELSRRALAAGSLVGWCRAGHNLARVVWRCCTPASGNRSPGRALRNMGRLWRALVLHLDSCVADPTSMLWMLNEGKAIDAPDLKGKCGVHVIQEIELLTPKRPRRCRPGARRHQHPKAVK